jgi:hypothetical protein
MHYGSLHVMRLEAGWIWTQAALDFLLIRKNDLDFTGDRQHGQ